MFSCQSQGQETELLYDVSSISASKSNGYGGINEKFFITFQKDSQKAQFAEIINNAKESKQRIDMVKKQPDFDILIRYEDGNTHGLNLILGDTEEKASFSYVGHENYSYNISARDTKLLRNLLGQ